MKIYCVCVHVLVQEVMELRMHHQSRMVEVDSGRQKEFESKMAEAMQQLRQDHETQIQQYREELERTFAAKVLQYSIARETCTLPANLLKQK